MPHNLHHPRFVPLGFFALALLQLSGCNPYAPLVGQSFSRIDEYSQQQTDEVPVIAGGSILRSLTLVRRKQSGSISGYSVSISVETLNSMRIDRITFDGGSESLRLMGGSALADVRATTHDVRYTTFASFAITPAQVEQLSEFEEVVVVVSGPIDLPPVRLGPKGLYAIDVFRDTFVTQDGMGGNVSRTHVRTSE